MRISLVSQIDSDQSIPCAFCSEFIERPLARVEQAPAFLGCTQAAASEDLFLSFHIYVCAKCGLIQTDANPIASSYAEIHSEALGPTWEAHHAAFAQFISGVAPSISSVLEIGASAQPIARRLKNIKKITYIDPIRKVPFTLQENETYMSGFFPDVFPQEKVELIIASHVLEHIPQTSTFLQKIWDHLLPNGIFAISIPYFEMWFRNFYFNAISAEHLIYPFASQLSCLGYQFDSQYYGEHSLFAVFRKTKKTPSFEQNHSLTYLTKWIERFNKSVQAPQIHLSKHSLFLAGASHLSQYFLLCNPTLAQQIVGVLDNSPRKWGHRLYGTEVKACSFEALKEHDSPFVILPPSPYAQEMRQQIQNISPPATICLL